ncbi:hypothetical protein BJX99DRAFT_222621 [Aspergillus californicus]
MSHNPESYGNHDQTSEYELLARTASPPPPIGLPKPEREPGGSFRTWTTLFLDTWLWEFLAIVFSLLCFAAIVCVLMIFDNKPRPDFAYGFTLNAIISILATASKSSLVYVIGECIGQLKWIWFHKAERKQLDDMQLFDSASRGPLGSLSVILQHKGQSLVSLGAIVIILALMFDPFMQQILTYPTKQVTESAESSSALAKQAFIFLPDTFSMHPQVIVNTGLWSELPQYLEPNVTCSSGDCDWPAFESVGLCSKCEDISSLTKFECEPFEFNADDPVLLRNRELNITCEVIPPQGRTFPITTTLSRYGGDGIYSYYYTMMEHMVWFPYQTIKIDNETFVGIENPHDVIAYTELALVNNRTSLPLLSDFGKAFRINKATQCAINLCSRIYNVSVSNGTALLKTSSPDYGQSWDDTISEAPTCWKPTHGLPLQRPNLTEYSRWNWGNTSEFTFCPNISYNLTEYFAGSINRGYMVTNETDWELGVLYDPTNQSLLKIIDIGLEPAMSNVAASFTKAGLLASNHTVTGKVYSSQVYVSVNWFWIILPAALVSLGALFLLLTIFTNKRQKLHLWKSSMLAVIFHGLNTLDTEAMTARSQTTTGDQMEKTARSIHVRLRTVDEQRGLMLDQS